MVNKHFYPASEQRFYECLLCKEIIYNPLCSTCLAGQVEVWLTSYPDLNKKLMPNIKKFIKEINNEIDEALTCVCCKQKRAAVCPYCFTEYVLGQLKKLDVNKQILREFLMFFDFDYDGTGYTGKDAEQLGVM